MNPCNCLKKSQIVSLDKSKSELMNPIDFFAYGSSLKDFTKHQNKGSKDIFEDFVAGGSRFKSLFQVKDNIEMHSTSRLGERMKEISIF